MIVYLLNKSNKYHAKHLCWQGFNNVKVTALSMSIINSDKLKQFLLLGIIICLGVILCWQLRDYLPGVLGAITLYILMRKQYFHLTVVKNWKKSLTAALFILIGIIVFVVPITLLIQVLLPRITAYINTPGQLDQNLSTIKQHVQQYVPQARFDQAQIQDLMKNIASALPAILGATMVMLVNTILAFFLLYFMLIDGRKMERHIQRFLPLKGENIDNIWEATRIMVVSNAIGIPVLAACQAITACIGYYIFGVKEAILWAVITGVFSLLPVVGTAAIWIPLSILMMAKGQVAQGIGVLLYGAAVISTLDNILRFTLLKKIGNVHPVITIMGVLVGVPMFGFIGFIFGPLLLSYMLLLVEIYRVEFSPQNVAANETLPGKSDN